MSKRSPRPRFDTGCGLVSIHHAQHLSSSGLRSDKRRDDVALGTYTACPANEAKHSIAFLKCTEAIEVEQGAARRLGTQFVVGHDDWTPIGKNKHLTNVVFLTQVDSTESDKNFCRSADLAAVLS